MTKRMIIDAAHPGETRVALLDRDQVYDYDFVTSSKTINKGNIYLAKITRVEPSLQAAFVEYGGGKQGFLPFSEIHPDYYQLPQDDKQKLLEEQIAEAEAEERAEEEAFEREQAARAVRSREHNDNGDEEDSEFEDFASEHNQQTPDENTESEQVFVYTEASAADSAVLASMPDIAPVEIPEGFVADEQGDYTVAPLSAEQFSVQSDADRDPLPEEIAENEAHIVDAQAIEDGVSGGDSHDTTAEDAEETRDRGHRSGASRGQSFHRRYRIQEVIKRNQIVLVQVIKEERGNKGCSLTTFISLAGRCAVLMPNSPKGGGISRKITDRDTRKRLKEVAAEMRTHRGMSVIIRTAGLDRTKAEIRRDYEYLVKLWNDVREQTLASTAPALIYEEGNLIKRSLRDLYTSDVEEVIVEGEEAYHEAKNFMKMLMPSQAARIKQYTGTMPIFAYAGVEDQLAAMTEPQVRLPSGGYLVIHPTEALISIDVNSGRSTSERNVEETAIKTNTEAAIEVARQLRLRDLAGLIVIDFIDMNYGKNRKAVERTMKDALKADRAKIQIGRISMFGLMELSRQRLRPSISESMGVTCPHCRGTGYIHSVETVSIQIIRALEKEAATGDYKTLRIVTHPEAALHLLNEKRALLQSLEQRYHVSVEVLMDASLITGNFRLFKITAEGREILHEDAKSQAQQTGRGGRGGRGRRGGSGRREGGPLRFDDSITSSEPIDPAELIDPDREVLPDDDEIIGRPPERAPREGRERGDRPERGERGGRNRRGGRGRRPRGERPPREEGVTDETQMQPVTAEGDAPAVEGQMGTDAEKGDRNRRRGRRGGRNRSREPRPSRHEPGSIGNPVNAGEAAYDASSKGPSPLAGEGRDGGAMHSARPDPRPLSQPSSARGEGYSPAAKTNQPSFVIPLSPSQVNPPTAAPIISSGGTEEGKTKRKGWWSRVLES